MYKVLAIILTLYLRRPTHGQSCTPDNSNVASMQSCRNCRWASSCPGAAATFTSKYYGSWVKDRCENVVSVCGESEWDMTNNVGYMQYHATCVRYTVDSGYYSYRETCHTDCPTFTVFEYENAAGTCLSLNTLTIGEDSECLALCLDTIGCRGAKVSGTVCVLYGCDTHTTAMGNTFFKRTCTTDCASYTMQTCINCALDTSNCPSSYSTASESMSACSSHCLADTDCQSSTYTSAGSCLKYDCNLVTSTAGSAVLKKVCHTDCPEYTLERIDGETGDCVLDSDDYKSMTESECLANCLEMSGCRGVSFISSLHTCVYNNCTTSVADSNSVFIARHCISSSCTPDNSNVAAMQSCGNCRWSSSCPSAAAMFTDKYYGSWVKDRCENVVSVCGESVWDITNNVGYMQYHATCVRYTVDSGYSTYRETCNTDCPTFKMFEYEDSTGACTSLSSSIVTEDGECLALCFDTIGCRGAKVTGTLCVLYGCDTHTTAAGNTFYKRKCIEDCIGYTMQTCYGCATYYPNCPELYSYVLETMSDCSANCLADTDCQGASYTQPGECVRYDCNLLAPSAGNTVFKKVCHTDCPEYTLERLDGAIGDCVLDFDDYTAMTEESECLANCLEMPGCRGVSFISSLHKCVYNNCTTSVADSDSVFIARHCIGTSCIPDDSNVAAMQSCVNCRWSTSCPGAAATFTDIYYGSWVKDRCENVVSVCGESMWEKTSNVGYMQHHATCVSYTVDSDYSTYRETCNADCPTFKMFEYEDSTGACTSLSSRIVSEDGECLALCFDTVGCRGAKVTGTLCVLYRCDTHTTAAGNTFYKRTCLDDCSSHTMQTCLNCATDYPNCPSRYSEVVEDMETCSEHCMNDTDCQTATYEPSGRCVHYDCNLLTLDTGGSVVLKKVCHTDCPEYRLERLDDEAGDCVLDFDDYKSMTESECLANCLEMSGCRGVSFISSLHKCVYNNCTTSVSDDDSVFIARHCIVPTYTQTCKNCKPSTNCSSELTVAAMTDDNQLSGTCSTTCSADDECQMAFFDPSNNRCTYHTCTDITQASHSTMVYRTTENPECLEYEIFVMNGYRASCGSALSTTEDVSDISQCISACADLQGCVGITYYNHSTSCDYFNCTDMSEATGHIFVKKVCTTGIPCSKDYVQTCLNCHVGQYCQGYTQFFINQPTIEDCISKLTSDGTANIFVYNKTHGFCGMSECSKVRQQPYVTMVTARKTCSTVCSTYRLFTVEEHEGACAEFETDLGGVSEDYCIERCLDMDNCLGVSYNENEAWCKYHNCLESQPNANFNFIRRECVDTTVPKPYTQTCWNCDSSCTSAVDSQTSVMSDIDCNVGCGSTCVSAKFDPSINQCDIYQCDIAMLPDVGAVVKRKTSNQDCLEFELFAYVSKIPTCTSIGQTTGVRNVDLCVNTCLDMPGCRATTFISNVCSYYNCTTFIDSPDPGFLILRYCTHDCNITMHTCFNCVMGPDCPSAAGSLTSSETDCVSTCNTNGKCGAVEYSASLGQCSIYSCGEVSRQYQSTVYRKSCDSDCPLYEVYEWTGQRGTCNTMMTEYYIAMPYLCLERCLNMPGCRAVSYKPYECSYHSCDCSEPGANNNLFLWRYCLDSETNLTVLPSGNSTLPTEFPKSFNCALTTTSTTLTTVSTTPTNVLTTPSTVTTTPSSMLTTPSTVTTTSSHVTTTRTSPNVLTTSSTVTTSPSNVTTTPSYVTTTPSAVTTAALSSLPTTTNSPGALPATVSVQPNAIYLTPCFCSSGVYTNKTNAEIIAEIVESLTVNPKNVSSERRRLTCAEDDRTSSQLMGAVGSLCLVVSAVLVTGADIATVVRTLLKRS